MKYKVVECNLFILDKDHSMTDKEKDLASDVDEKEDVSGSVWSVQQISDYTSIFYDYYQYIYLVPAIVPH